MGKAKVGDFPRRVVLVTKQSDSFGNLKLKRMNLGSSYMGVGLQFGMIFLESASDISLERVEANPTSRNIFI
tara:strand:+ start:251 stop:466 length:216 start_codon:yes stop_codon:yes gene_type:complete